MYVLIHCNVSYCNQFKSIFIIIIFGDGLAQGLLVEFGGGLVVHNTIIGYVNKLTTLVALLYFSSEVFTIS